MASRLFAVLVVLLLHINLTLAASAVSIRSEAGFKAMRECARDCLAWNGSGDLLGKFGCNYPAPNDCLCRTDLAAAATKHLSTCCAGKCAVGPAEGDISTAINVYQSYCMANGYDVVAGAAAAPSVTPITRPAGATNAATSRQQPASNQPAQTGNANSNQSSSGGGGGGLSTGAMIGIIAPIVSIVGVLIGLGLKVYFGRKQARNEKQRLHQQQQWGS